MRRFVLDRSEDVSGISGVGTVAEGVEFSDGVCVIRWKTVPVASTAIYDTAQELIDVHGHEGATQIRWIDPSLDATVDIKAVTDDDEAQRYGDSIPSAWRTDRYDV